VREDHVALPSGVEIDRYWVNEYGHWVNVVALTPDDRIVLLRQYRHGLQAVHYEIPGGVADTQDFMSCAQRELREETGYGGGIWTPLMVTCPNPALQTNLVHSFLAEGVEELGAPAPEETEDLRIHLVSVSDVLTLIDSGEFAQAIQLAPLLRYLLSRP
jgi:8-oxo-dGTP pyrophosphatase MutT (NUDIX family)